jgi:ribonuclease HII
VKNQNLGLFDDLPTRPMKSSAAWTRQARAAGRPGVRGRRHPRSGAADRRPARFEKLNEAKRDMLAPLIKAAGAGLGDRRSVGRGNRQAQHPAGLDAGHAPRGGSAETVPTLALIDGNRCPVMKIQSIAIVGGDDKVEAISAASILAKTARDAALVTLHAQYPQYCFDQHKGYGTALHLARLREHGPSPVHRRSFAPVRALLGEGI